MRKIWNTMLKGLVALLPVGLPVSLVYWLAVAAETLFSRVLKLVMPDSAYWPGLGLVAGLLAETRMIDFFKENSAQPLDEFIKNIVEDVKSHVRNAEQSDDITSMILKRT